MSFCPVEKFKLAHFFCLHTCVFLIHYYNFIVHILHGYFNSVIQIYFIILVYYGFFVTSTPSVELIVQDIAENNLWFTVVESPFNLLDS